MEQHELDYIRKRAKLWSGSAMIQVDFIERVEQLGRAKELNKLAEKYEDLVVAP